MARILVTEEIAENGLDKLRAAGHEVDVRLGLDRGQLLEAVAGAHALIIRSATQVDAAVLDAAPALQVVGRAGIGLDNVEVAHATANGVMVVNAPQSNVISAAEHTVALLLAQARNIPQAHLALSQGRWERSAWTGVELADKTLGIIGLGRIGKLVAQRALAFGMRLVGYDPFVSPERARQLSVDLVDLDELAARSDFITVHVAKTPDTVGLVGAEFLARTKPGVRIINVARGGIVDEAALHEAIVSGRVGGAALDVFATEPCTDSPLFALPQVVATPHLGASTHEAQDKAGETIAEQLALALAGDFVPFAVNVDASEVAETVRPFLPLAEQLGGLFAALTGKLPPVVEVVFEGDIGGYDNKLAVLSAVKGLLAQISDEPVSYVNALSLLDDRGVEVRMVASSTAHDYVNRLSVRGGGRNLSATLIGLRDEARLVQVDDHIVDLPPAANMLIVRNDDRPGMIGVVGTLLGDAGVNIDDMDVGRDVDAISAVMVIATRQPASPDLVGKLRSTEGILSVDALHLR
jgi:D-3-phosphoglycerate dehydrogenase / 2-oxoglutarate reductase